MKLFTGWRCNYNYRCYDSPQWRMLLLRNYLLLIILEVCIQNMAFQNSINLLTQGDGSTVGNVVCFLRQLLIVIVGSWGQNAANCCSCVSRSAYCALLGNFLNYRKTELCIYVIRTQVCLANWFALFKKSLITSAVAEPVTPAIASTAWVFLTATQFNMNPCWDYISIYLAGWYKPCRSFNMLSPATSGRYNWHHWCWRKPLCHMRKYFHLSNSFLKYRLQSQSVDPHNLLTQGTGGILNDVVCSLANILNGGTGCSGSCSG